MTFPGHCSSIPWYHPNTWNSKSGQLYTQTNPSYHWHLVWDKWVGGYTYQTGQFSHYMYLFQQVWKKDFNEAHCCFIMECNTSNMFSTLHVRFNSTFTHIWQINKFVTHCTQRLSVIRLKWLQPVLVLFIWVPLRDISTNFLCNDQFCMLRKLAKAHQKTPQPVQ